MNPHILIINGPPAVGKSAVAAALRELMSGSVCIPGDTLRHFASAQARAELGPGSTYRAAAALASFYLEAGATRVIFEYVFESPRQLQYFEARLCSSTARQVVTLWASLATLEVRDSRRAGVARQGARVRECVSSMTPHLQSLGWVVDTEDLAANEVAGRIHQFARGLYEGAT